MGAVRTEAKHFVTLAVDDLPDIPLFVVTDTMISPEWVRIIYAWKIRPDDKHRDVIVEVSGPRRLDNGKLDRSRAPWRTHFGSHDTSEWPDWLTALVKENAPTDLNNAPAA